MFARAPNLLWVDMAKVTREYAALYQRVDPTPPLIPVPIHVTPFRVNSNVPSEAEVLAAIKRLCLNKASGHTNLHTDNFNKWLR